MKWIGFILLAFLVGCGPSTQSGVHKNYNVDIRVSENSTATFYMGVDAESQADTESGDAEAVSSVDPAIALGMQGSTTSAAAKGADQLLEGISNAIKQYSENKDRHDTQTAPAPVTPPADSGGTDTGSDSGDVTTIDIEPLDLDTLNLDDYDVVAVAACDEEMSYRHGDESPGTIQKKCVFDKPGTEFGDSFIVSWSSGNKLAVPDSSKMAWDMSDFRKYQPHDPETGTGPAEVYAGREDNSTKVNILAKK